MLTFKFLVAADLVTRAAPDTDEVEDARMGCPMRLTVVEDVFGVQYIPNGIALPHSNAFVGTFGPLFIGSSSEYVRDELIYKYNY